MASIFFKCIKLDTRICAFSLFTILIVWDRTWNKLLKLQDLKIQTMLKVVFILFNKSFNPIPSSSASHCFYSPLIISLLYWKNVGHVQFSGVALSIKGGRHEIVEPTTCITKEQIKLNKHLLSTYYKHITFTYLGRKTTLKIDRIMLILQMGKFDTIIGIISMTLFQ